MSLVRKFWHRSFDPVFYRKRYRILTRRFKTFRDSPEPLDLAKENWKRVVGVVAHPDDETFCSGLLTSLASRGANIKILCLTRGEGGPTGGIARSELGDAREQEMRSACQVLGVGDVRFLGHVDPLAVPYRVFAPDVTAQTVAIQIEAELDKADLILSHGSSGEYWHPAHLLVFEAVRRVMKKHPSQPDWLTFLARQPNHPIPRLINWDDEADLFLDVSNCEETRQAALACHQSQLGLFAKFGGGQYGDFIRKTSRETYHRANH